MFFGDVPFATGELLRSCGDACEQYNAAIGDELLMDDLEQRALELGKRLYGENCELVRRTEWSYKFKCGPKSFSISRFLAEPGFDVSAAEITRRWPLMDDKERTDFALNFHSKKAWTANDTEILEVIMKDGNDHIWSSCALAMLKHPDRNRAVEFLINRVKESGSERPPLNYFQALGMAKDRRAIPLIRPYYDRYLKEMEKEVAMGVPGDVFLGPIPYHAFLSIAGDLYKIEPLEEYERALRKFFEHPNEQVRYWAEYALGVQGPTTLKRRAEHARKPR